MVAVDLEDMVGVDSEEIRVDSVGPLAHNLGPMLRLRPSTKEEVSVDQDQLQTRMPRPSPLIRAVASMVDSEGLDQRPQLMLRPRALANKDFLVVLEVPLVAPPLPTPTHKPSLDFDVVRSWNTKIKNITL